MRIVWCLLLLAASPAASPLAGGEAAAAAFSRLYRNGDWRSAERIAATVLERRPAAWLWWNYRGCCANRMGRHALAVEAFERGRRLPDAGAADKTALYLHADSLLREGYGEAAEARFDELARRYPASRLVAPQGDLARALRAWSRPRIEGVAPERLLRQRILDRHRAGLAGTVLLLAERHDALTAPQRAPPPDLPLAEAVVASALELDALAVAADRLARLAEIRERPPVRLLRARYHLAADEVDAAREVLRELVRSGGELGAVSEARRMLAQLSDDAEP